MRSSPLTLLLLPQTRTPKAASARQMASSSSTPGRAPPPSSAASSSSSSSVAPSPKLNSATHKLKKDIHRCHRMSRRPLLRCDPAAPAFPSRLNVLPFSETVRILNRRVKPREVKRGRIILNLKVVDKPGRGGRAAAGGGAGRHNLPSRNRIIGKKGEAPCRPFQAPLKMLGFPMYGKPFGLQCGGPPHPGPSTGDSQPTSSQHRPPPSSSAPSDPKASAAQSCGPPAETQEDQSAAPAPQAPPPAPCLSPPSLEDGRTTQEACRKSPRQRRAKRQLPAASVGSAPPRDHSSAPVEPQRAPAEGDPNWHPEMAPSCKDVVVTDVTTNLVTVTIKEFPSPASGPASPSAPSPDDPPPPKP